MWNQTTMARGAKRTGNVRWACWLVVGAMATGVCAQQMPTADILRHREVSIEYTLSGTETGIDGKHYHNGAVVLGLWDRLELRADHDLDKARSWSFNLLALEDRTWKGFALSGGFAGLNGRQGDPFVAARQDFSGWRAHLAWQRGGGLSRLHFGVDFPVFGDSAFVLESQSGPHGYSWATLSLPIKPVPGLSLDLAVGYPHVRTDGVQHQASLWWIIRL